MNSEQKTTSEFKQGKYETQLHFFRRMDKTAQEAITKAELEVQFDVKFERQGKNKLIVSKTTDPLAGHKATKSKIEPEVNRRYILNGGGAIRHQIEPIFSLNLKRIDIFCCCSKSQKRKEKLHEKVKQKKAYNRDEFAEMHGKSWLRVFCEEFSAWLKASSGILLSTDFAVPGVSFDFFRFVGTVFVFQIADTVEFGEVVMAPPQMNAAPRKAPRVKVLVHFVL